MIYPFLDEKTRNNSIYTLETIREAPGPGVSEQDQFDFDDIFAHLKMNDHFNEKRLLGPNKGGTCDFQRS